MLLTSSIDAHSFHIFELRPYSRVGKSCISGRRSTGSHREATVWHRYKLVRGYTSADVRDVVWAWDSKIVTVVTDRGTHHLFAIHPAGGHNHPTNDNPQYSSVGTPDLPSILTLATSNPLVFQPLSITISSFTTIKPKHILRNQNQSSSTNGMIIPMISKDQIESNETHESETDHHHLHHHSQTSFIFLQPNDEQMNEERSSRREEFEKVLNPLHKRLPSGLLFDHLTQSVVLYNLDVKKKLMSLSSSHRTVSSPTKAAMISEHHSKPRKKSAPSGLSQLMQQQADLNEPHHHHQSHSVNCTATVIWSLLPNQPQMEQTRLYETEDSNGLVGGIHQVKKLKGERWTSFVELDTFSHSINILPKSIYTYHQFDFYHFKETYEQIEDLMKDLSLSSSSLSSSSQRRLKKLIVRQEVIIEPGGNPNEVPGEFINLGFQERNQMNAIRYEEPIKSAVETILDTSAYHPTLTRNFLMNPSPGFPNGQPGKRGGHHQFKVLSRLSLQNATKRISSNSTNGSSKAKEEKISISFDDGVIKVDSSEEDEDEDEDEVSPISDLDVEEEEEKIGWDAWAIDEEEFGKQPIPVQVQVQVEVEKNAGGGGGGASSSTEAFSITDTNTTRTTDSSTSDGTGSGSGSGSGSGLGGGKVKGAQKSKGSNGARNGRGPRRS